MKLTGPAPASASSQSGAEAQPTGSWEGGRGEQPFGKIAVPQFPHQQRGDGNQKVPRRTRQGGQLAAGTRSGLQDEHAVSRREERHRRGSRTKEACSAENKLSFIGTGVKGTGCIPTRQPQPTPVLPTDPGSKKAQHPNCQSVRGHGRTSAPGVGPGPLSPRCSEHGSLAPEHLLAGGGPRDGDSVTHTRCTPKPSQVAESYRHPPG